MKRTRGAPKSLIPGLSFTQCMRQNASWTDPGSFRKAGRCRPTSNRKGNPQKSDKSKGGGIPPRTNSERQVPHCLPPPLVCPKRQTRSARHSHQFPTADQKGVPGARPHLHRGRRPTLLSTQGSRAQGCFLETHPSTFMASGMTTGSLDTSSSCRTRCARRMSRLADGSEKTRRHSWSDASSPRRTRSGFCPGCVQEQCRISGKKE